MFHRYFFFRLPRSTTKAELERYTNGRFVAYVHTRVQRPDVRGRVELLQRRRRRDEDGRRGGRPLVRPL